MIKGIYIHVPFCTVKCPYCDFMSFVSDDTNLMELYIDYVIRELKLYSGYKDFSVETVYFGGGTPTVLKPDLLVRVIEFIKENIKHNKTLEITVECNPETYRYEEFRVIKGVGVNRISIGSQSFLEKNLKILGRKHKPEDTLATVESALKAGIENINLDMIYAIPEQTTKELEEDLKIYASLPITHVSAYMLTAYEDTPFRKLIEEDKLSLPEEKKVFEMFVMVDNFLNERGFKRYELSNWAKEGFECKHNLLYWTHGEFLGVGVSAWSYVNGRRIGNERNFELYMKKLERYEIPVVYEEIIDERERYKEHIFLGLRLSRGISIDNLNPKKVEGIIEGGYGFVEEGRLKLTQQGLMVLNEISRYLIEG